MINASIVLFKNKKSDIEQIIDAFFKFEKSNFFYLIDNSPKQELQSLSKLHKNIKYIFNGKNVGYGSGHNIALNESKKNNIPFHLIINPDIEMKNNTIEKLYNYMLNNKDVGIVMPKILNANGSIQYLCKKLPNPLDLFLRFFTKPNFMLNYKNKFILKNTEYNKIMNVPYLSGCFMFLNMQSINSVGMFDERFFMYAEDIDISRRIHKKYKTIFFPFVSVVHHHEKASYKNIKMALIHIYSVIKYFNKWGWFFDKDRENFNSRLNKYF